MHDALFDADLLVFDSYLPVGLGIVTPSGVFGRANMNEAAYGWTLLPYYAHFNGSAAIQPTCERNGW